MSHIISSFDKSFLKKQLCKLETETVYGYSLTTLQINDAYCDIQDIIIETDNIDYRQLNTRNEFNEYYILYLNTIKDDIIFPHCKTEYDSCIWTSTVLNFDKINHYTDIHQTSNNEFDILQYILNKKDLRHFENINSQFHLFWFIKPRLYVFNDQYTQLFINYNLSMSSLPLKNSVSILPNMSFFVDFQKKRLRQVGNFKTKKI